MLQNSDIQGRLRLFRYGLIVVIAITFLVSLLAPYVVTSAYASELNKVAEAAQVDTIDISIATFFGQALVTTLVVAIALAVVYFAYRSYLLKSATAVHA